VNIIIYPDPVLRRKNTDVGNEEVQYLYSQLVTEMINHGGVGLAAPQIGVNKRIAVVSEKADEKLQKPLALVNPEIIQMEGRQSIEEGCLSIAGVTASVPRAAKIKVETGIGRDRKVIEAESLLAIVIQHETDHLNGILFPDRLKFHKKIWYLMKARRNKKCMKK